MVIEDLQKNLQPLLPPGKSLDSIQKLFGEASYREYFRVTTSSNETYVLMKLPPGKQSVSEEITNYQGEKNEIPFLNMARYLQAHQLPVPKVLATDLSRGLILLQDLGDKTLEKILKDSTPAMGVFFYKQAVDLLLRWQAVGEKFRDEDCMAFRRSFDPHLLEWEYEHFIEYGIEDRFSLKIPEAKRKSILEMGKDLVKKIIEIPYGLTHRDFQSRNLLLFGYDFYLIDFQDALLGPPQYDLVALLRDSYVELPFETVQQLIDCYLQNRKKARLPELDPEEFLRNFHRITLQRKLKDAGRFQYIHKVKGNPNFLPHVPTSLTYVKQAFAELKEYQPLREALASYVPELR